jgi:hypothetical protein
VNVKYFTVDSNGNPILQKQCDATNHTERYWKVFDYFTSINTPDPNNPHGPGNVGPVSVPSKSYLGAVPIQCVNQYSDTLPY